MNADGDRPLRVLGIGGSLRQPSHSLALLRAALALAGASGAGTVLADVRKLDLPFYDPDLHFTQPTATMSWLVEQARAADAFIFCSPTYLATVSAPVKNALDILDLLIDDTPRFLGGKPVALIAAGGGSAANVITALNHAARAINSLVIPTSLAVSGRLIDPDTLAIADDAARDRLHRLVDELLVFAGRLRTPSATDPRRETELRSPTT